MKNVIENEVIEAAANYWTAFLIDPLSFEFDNGDDSPTGRMSKMMANMGKQKEYSEEEIKAFKKLLCEKLIAQKPFRISIDYNANGILKEVADATLTKWSDMSTFPCKTGMSINYEEGVVAVSQGYYQPTVIIYETEDVA